MKSRVKERLFGGGAVVLFGVVGWSLGPLFLVEEVERVVRVDVEKSELMTEEELVARWEKDVEPMVVEYCFDCHGDGMEKGGLDFDRYPDLASMRKDKKVWEHVLSRVEYRLMPPARKDQPSDEERERLVAWINEAVFPADANDPGMTVMRRMNRVEYGNTIRDLLGVDVAVEDLLPADDSGYGFDNVGSALSISPMHVEKYLEAADVVLEKALVMGSMKPGMVKLDARKMSTNGRVQDGGVYFTQAGFVRFGDGVRKGRYRLHLVASATEAGNEPAFMDVMDGGDMVKRFKVESGGEKGFVMELDLGGSKGDLEVRFSNDFYDPENPNPNRRDRNLLIHELALEGPLGEVLEKPASHRAVFVERAAGVSDRDYAEAVLGRFARRAFRGGVGDGEMSRYVDFAERLAVEQGSWEMGVKGAIQAMLVSPRFLFLEPELVDVQDGRGLLSEVSLAERLSYFLWSTMPDEELLGMAERGELRKNLASVVERMLADERGVAFVENFVGQWLQLRDMDLLRPSSRSFRDFDSRLLGDMKRETEMLVREVFLRDGNLLTLLDADYSYLNGRLARHYGVRGVEGNEFRKVSLAGTGRRGILMQGSLLTLTSHPTRTSPVLRGKYVLENLLDITPPPPPADLPDLKEKDRHGRSMSMREQLEMHRAKSSCAGCHSLMDPIGFAMEHFDGVGRFREKDEGRAIDASGKLVTGEKLDGAESLRSILVGDKRDEFVRCVVVKMMTYALGRGVARSDRLGVDKIVSEVKSDEYGARSLIMGVIESVPFQYGKVSEEKAEQ